MAEAALISPTSMSRNVIHLLGGELYTPLHSYSVANKPLGASLLDTLKAQIRLGEYVNLQLLLTEEDEGETFQWQHQPL